jgi:hypothetical protein
MLLTQKGIAHRRPVLNLTLKGIRPKLLKTRPMPKVIILKRQLMRLILKDMIPKLLAIILMRRATLLKLLAINLMPKAI